MLVIIIRRARTLQSRPHPPTSLLYIYCASLDAKDFPGRDTQRESRAIAGLSSHRTPIEGSPRPGRAPPPASCCLSASPDRARVGPVGCCRIVVACWPRPCTPYIHAHHSSLALAPDDRDAVLLVLASSTRVCVQDLCSRQFLDIGGSCIGASLDVKFFGKMLL